MYSGCGRTMTRMPRPSTLFSMSSMQVSRMLALLPRRRNEHHIPTGRVALNGGGGELIFGNLAIEQVVAAFHKIFALGAVELLGTAQLAHLMGARAQYRVVVVVGRPSGA